MYFLMESFLMTYFLEICGFSSILMLFLQALIRQLPISRNVDYQLNKQIYFNLSNIITNFLWYR